MSSSASRVCCGYSGARVRACVRMSVCEMQRRFGEFMNVCLSCGPVCSRARARALRREERMTAPASPPLSASLRLSQPLSASLSLSRRLGFAPAAPLPTRKIHVFYWRLVNSRNVSRPPPPAAAAAPPSRASSSTPLLLPS